MRLLVFFLSIFISTALWAQVESSSETVRIYPGGVDEDNLEVQEALPQPYSDVNKAAIIKQIYENMVSQKENSN